MNLDTDLLAELFKQNGWTWNLKGRGHVIPTAEDIDIALDTAAQLLYDEDPDANPQMNIGRLIIQKTHRTHHVFVYCGDYD